MGKKMINLIKIAEEVYIDPKSVTYVGLDGCADEFGNIYNYIGIIIKGTC